MTFYEYEHSEVKIRSNMTFYSLTLTLILKPDLNMPKIHLCTENKVPSFSQRMS